MKKTNNRKIFQHTHHTNQKGITLVALVITIIVIMILSITTFSLIGAKSIINKTEEGKNKTDEQVARESIEIGLLQSRIEYVQGNEIKSFYEYIFEEPERLESIIVNSKVNIEDKTITSNGYEFKINEDLTIEKITTKPITNIELNTTELTIEEIQKKSVIATKNEDATETIEWISSDPKVARVELGEKEGEVIITGVLAGSATITAQNKKGDIQKTIQVTVTAAPIGKYVKYNIPYTDVINSSYTYNENNGWRLLSKKINEEDSSLYDIEIVSTGVPAGLLYHYNIKSQNTWGGTETQRNDYVTEFFSSGSIENSNMYGASGLYYNFEKINFKCEDGKTSWNAKKKHYGYYTQINGITGTEIHGNVFRTADTNISDKIKGIRSITLADLTGKKDTTTSYTDVQGLFDLTNLSKSSDAAAKGVNTYTYKGSLFSPLYLYYMATPDVAKADYIYRMISSMSVSITTDNGYYCGVRPVISISGVSIKDVDGMWEIY